MNRRTYVVLQSMAGSVCSVATVAGAQVLSAAVPVTSLAGVLTEVGWSDWLAVALVSLSFGMVSLLQRFKRSEAGAHYALFVAAHISGSLLSGIVVYLMTQAALDSPNRFAQALAIGAAGWGGSAVADKIAERINEYSISKASP